MNILIKNAVITDPTSPFNGQLADLFISKGTIQAIGNSLNFKADTIIEEPGLQVSPGWLDLFADFADPGFEYRENLENGAAAAAAGGYTGVCLIPNTQPVADQKSVIEYIIKKSASLPVTIYPIGSISRKAEGRELSEMYDMKLSGAVAFTDGLKPVQSAGVLVKALQYVKSFNGVIVQLPDDQSIQPHGQMTEGITSTKLGLMGRPELAEEIQVARDVKLAAYAESRLHLTGISTENSVNLVKESKKKTTGISCSITPYHLFFCDEDLAGYDSNLKVNPPLRNKKDRKALQKAVEAGIVDCIASHHLPQDRDHKVVEFEYAQPGMIGLQTTYAALNTVLPSVNQEKWVELLDINPRKVLSRDFPTIDIGRNASLTLFNPKTKWKLVEEDIRSSSKNSPFTGMELTGKPVGIIHNNKLVLNGIVE